MYINKMLPSAHTSPPYISRKVCDATTAAPDTAESDITVSGLPEVQHVNSERLSVFD